MYTPALSFSARLNALLTQSATTLPVSQEAVGHFCSEVLTGYTYLTIKIGSVSEEVKARCVDNTIHIERGPQPRAFAQGTCVDGRVTETGLAELDGQGVTPPSSVSWALPNAVVGGQYSTCLVVNPALTLSDYLTPPSSTLTLVGDRLCLQSSGVAAGAYDVVAELVDSSGVLVSVVYGRLVSG